MEDTNVDYRKMYYHLAGAVETALRILISAQQDCENILLENDNSASDTSTPTGDQYSPLLALSMVRIIIVNCPLSIVN